MKVHPVAEMFPMLGEAELAALVEDIKSNGLLQPLVRKGGTLLDGRNRLAACKLAGVEPRWQEYGGDDPARFIVGANLHRRHLTTSQRAMVANKLARLNPTDTLKRGSRSAILPNGETTQSEAAELLSVSPRSVRQARAVEEASPELAQAVFDGEITVTAALRNLQRDDAKRRAVELPKGKFRVLYADPPWKYGDDRQGLTSATGAEAHYPCMTIAELCGLPVKDLAHDDAVLFLWTTSPILPESFAVLKAWGFTYKASFVWNKLAHNLGHYNSVRHEFLLVATRGSCLPDSKQLVNSVQSIKRTKHSEKPHEFRAIIEQLYTHGDRVELFARTAAPGWECWGDELANPALVRPV